MKLVNLVCLGSLIFFGAQSAFAAKCTADVSCLCPVANATCTAVKKCTVASGVLASACTPVPGIKCNDGYVMVGTKCMKQICTPKAVETIGCATTAGGVDTRVKTRICSVSGLLWGAWSACKCTADVSCSCPVLNASCSAAKKCNLTTGALAAACTPGAITCNSNYSLVGIVCKPYACTPKTSESRDCTATNGKGAQWRYCPESGLAWGVWSACGCYADQPCVCTVANDATGGFCKSFNYCNKTTGKLGVCTPDNSLACKAGYTLVKEKCVAGKCAPLFPKCVKQVCSPNVSETAACAFTNGTGTKTRTCPADGLVWGAYSPCALATCNALYSAVDGKCVKIACTAGVTLSSVNCVGPNGNGLQTRTCNANKIVLGPCLVNQCKTGFTLDGGKCVAQVCGGTKPDREQVNLTIANGSGSKVRNCQDNGLWPMNGKIAVWEWNIYCDSGYRIAIYNAGKANETRNCIK